MTAVDFDISRHAYAHRGLWGGNIPENSVAAFRAASAAGLGCELDLRMTRDGELVVFHDADLKRMCADPGRISDLRFVELRGHKLPDGSRIPTLREALEAMNGLPTLIEIKIDPPNRHIVPPLIQYLQDLSVPATVMSFDEWTVWRLTTLLPGYRSGQLIEPLSEIGEDGVREKAARAREIGCAYLCPHHTSLAQAGKFLPLVTWTVRTPAELKRARKHAAAPIFEGLAPSTVTGLANPSRTPI
jgi:glycerophosphoryl diester phosphodiesterase